MPILNTVSTSTSSLLDFLYSLLPVFAILFVVRYFKKSKLDMNQNQSSQVEYSANPSFIYNYYISFISSLSALIYWNYLYIHKDSYSSSIPIVSNNQGIQYLYSLITSAMLWFANRNLITGLLGLLIFTFSPIKFYNYSGASFVEAYFNLFFNIPLFIVVFGYSIFFDSMVVILMICIAYQNVFKIESPYLGNEANITFIFVVFILSCFRIPTIFFPNLKILHIPVNFGTILLSVFSHFYLYSSSISIVYILFKRFILIDFTNQLQEKRFEHHDKKLDQTFIKQSRLYTDSSVQGESQLLI